MSRAAVSARATLPARWCSLRARAAGSCALTASSVNPLAVRPRVLVVRLGGPVPGPSALVKLAQSLHRSRACESLLDPLSKVNKHARERRALPRSRGRFPMSTRALLELEQPSREHFLDEPGSWSLWPPPPSRVERVLSAGLRAPPAGYIKTRHARDLTSASHAGRARIARLQMDAQLIDAGTTRWWTTRSSRATTRAAAGPSRRLHRI